MPHSPSDRQKIRTKGLLRESLDGLKSLITASSSLQSVLHYMRQELCNEKLHAEAERTENARMKFNFPTLHKRLN